MFFQINNRYNKPVLINSEAIIFVKIEAEIQVSVPGQKKMETVTGVRILFSASAGIRDDRLNTYQQVLIYQEFIGEQAEKLRQGLPQILNAHFF